MHALSNETAVTAEAPSSQRTGTGPVAAVYASFALGEEEFALDVAQVREVVHRPPSLVAIPLTPDFVLGVFDLRGAIVPVLDMRRLMRDPNAGSVSGSKVAIADHRGMRLGLVFDDTRRVLRPQAHERTLFDYEDRSPHRVVAGVLRLGSDMVQVLDFDRLMALGDVPHPRKRETSLASARVRRVQSRCITLRVGKSLLAFRIADIHEIVPARGIEKSPIQDPLCYGVLQIRGQIVPMVRLAQILQIEEDARGDAEAQQVVILRIERFSIGLVVDAVESIDGYDEDDALPVPVLGRSRSMLFLGCIDFGARGHVLLLDHRRLLEDDEIGRITGQYSKLFTRDEESTRVRQQSLSDRAAFLWVDSSQSFVLPMPMVREIVDASSGIIAMPGAPEFACGMLDFRGQLITVVSLARFYKLAPSPEAATGPGKIVVLDSGGARLGLHVDAVRSILRVDRADRFAVPQVMRNSLPEAVRKDVSEVIRTQGDRGENVHLLALNVLRLFEAMAVPASDGAPA